MGVQRQVPRMRVDWWQLVVDLSRHGMAQAAVGKSIQVAGSTLHGWKMGAEPRHAEGEALLRLWCQATGHARELVPMTSKYTWK